MARLAAVTGATGFLGRRLVSALIEKGFSVRALVRRGWDGEAIDTVEGDLADEAALARLTDGAEILIHVAGAVKARGRGEFMAVNGEGAGRASRAAAKSGARAILVSSLVAREPQLSDYARSKWAGEGAARAELGERLTIFRPPAIYGPGDRATLDLFRAAAGSPVLPVPDVPSARLAIAYVDDVCSAICALAAAAAGAGPGPYEFGGARPSGYSWSEIVAALARASGRRLRPVAVPPWALTLAGAAAEGVSRLTRSPSMLTLGKTREILHPDWTVDVAHATPPPYGPTTDLEDGFARTLSWYRDRAWIG
jgi:nucleoside-diphosphate-sugar epimerase